MNGRIKEQNISEFYSKSGDRKAVVSRDTYHIIARLYDITSGGVLREYNTMLYTDSTISDIENECESFVLYEGKYKR